MHFNRPAEPGLHGFDIAMTEDEITKSWKYGCQSAADSRKYSHQARAWRPFKDPARIWLDADKLPLARYDEDARGTYIARKAIQLSGGKS